MSDATIQARIQTLIQATAEFANASVTLGDYTILNSGNPPYAVILPGPFGQPPTDGQRRNMPDKNTSTIWTHYIDIIEDFRDDSYADITAARQAVLDQLDAYPALNSLSSGIIHFLVVSGDPMRYLYPRGGGDNPQFVIARLTTQTYEFPSAGS